MIQQYKNGKTFPISPIPVWFVMHCDWFVGLTRVYHCQGGVEAGVGSRAIRAEHPHGGVVVGDSGRGEEVTTVPGKTGGVAITMA